METAPANPDSEPQPVQMTLWARLMNVFAAPGDVFEEVKNSQPSTANWLAPAFIFIVVGMISSIVIFSQPAIVQQIRDQQAKVMDQQVKAGKLTQAQADQALAAMDKFAGPTMLMAFGCVGAVVTILLTVITGKLGMTPSLALTVGDFDMKNKVHLLLAAVNIFSFWQIGVSACGLARLTGAPFSKALLVVGLYWLAFTLLFIGIGFGQMAM
jgi:hypothetical protein